MTRHEDHEVQRMLDEADREILLTVKEYAQLFRRHPQTIYTAIRCQTLPFAVECPTGRGYLIRVPAALVDKLVAKVDDAQPENDGPCASFLRGIFGLASREYLCLTCGLRESTHKHA